MKLAVPIPHACHELQRCEEEEDGASDDVQECRGRMCAESAVERRQLTGAFMGERVDDAERVEQRLAKGIHARGDVGREDAARERTRHADQHEEDDRAPQPANEDGAGRSATVGAAHSVAHTDRTNPPSGGCATAPWASCGYSARNALIGATRDARHAGT